MRVDVGRFTNDAWGIKGQVTLGRFFGRTIRTGVFIDNRGNFRLGNVNQYRLATSDQIQALRAMLAQDPNNPALQAIAEEQGIGFPSADEVALTVPITRSEDIVFALSRVGDSPTLTLQAPDGTLITLDDLPDGVTATTVMTYIHEFTDSPGMVAYLDDELMQRFAAIPVGGIESPLIRFINAAADEPAVAVRVDGASRETGIPWGAAGSYSDIDPGEHLVEFVDAADPTRVLASSTITVLPNDYLSAAVWTDGTNYQIALLQDQDQPTSLDDDVPAEPEIDTTDIRLLNGTSDLPMSLRLTNANGTAETIAAVVPSGAASDYTSMPAGIYNVAVTDITGVEVYQQQHVDCQYPDDRQLSYAPGRVGCPRQPGCQSLLRIGGTAWQQRGCAPGGCGCDQYVYPARAVPWMGLYHPD